MGSTEFVNPLLTKGIIPTSNSLIASNAASCEQGGSNTTLGGRSLVGELKTAIRPSITWLDGAHEITEIYENTVPQLFVPNILNFATEGKTFGYGGIRTPLQFWGPWRMDLDGGTAIKYLGLSDVGNEINDLLKPERLLDILKNFSLFSTNKKKQLIKILLYRKHLIKCLLI